MNGILRNWLILVALLAVLSGVGSYLEATGGGPVGAILVALGWLAVGAVAVADGVCRVLGKRCLLGAGEGFGRVLAAVQVLLGVLLLYSLVAALF